MLAHIISKAWPEWTVGRQIGGGSYGEVYEATRSDYSTGEKAAIKIIPIPQNELEISELRFEGSDDQSIKDHFSAVADECLDEIRTMLSLESCPHVVNLKYYTVVEQEDGIGRYILILMELLVPFDEYECDKVLSENDVIKLGCDICTALEACTEENILHRDIKPSNILVTKKGDFKLTDFGIARKLENRVSALTQSTGTQNYIAPEVAKSTTYDARADIYSLGLVLYRSLNKKRLPFLPVEKKLLTPHDKEDAYRRRVDDGEKLPPPCDASPLMAEVILRACAYDPKDRFSSATEMKQALIAASNQTDSYRYVDTPIAYDLIDNKGNPDQEGLPQLRMDKEATLYARETIDSNNSAKQNGLSEVQQINICDEPPIRTESEYLTAHTLDLDTIKRKAGQGDAWCQNYLGGRFCVTRPKTENDQPDIEAAKWFLLAAKQGYAPAQNNLGGCYFHGKGVPVNYSEAAKWFSNAAAQGYSKAYYNLAGCFYFGLGVEKSHHKATEYFRKAIEHLSVESDQGWTPYAVGDFLYYGKDKNPFFRNDTDLIKRQWCVLTEYENGSKLPSALALCYYFCSGATKDQAEAIRWYQYAEKYGNCRASRSIANYYLLEKNDYYQAITHYQRAAQNGDTKAKIIIGLCFLYGIVVPKNVDHAIAVLQEVADRNHDGYSRDVFDARIILAHLYSCGVEVKQDNAIAETWLKKASDFQDYYISHDYSNREYTEHRGDHYYYGYRVEKNIFKAIEWYQKSAGQGNATAQIKLGYCYQHGIGVPEDSSKAQKWYQMAVEQGNVVARILLDLLQGQVVNFQQRPRQWHVDSQVDCDSIDSKDENNIHNENLTAVTTDCLNEPYLDLENIKRKATYGDIEAQYDLAVLYANGRGIDQDEQKAVEWYTKAAEQRHSQAQFELGQMYENGRGVPQDNKRAVLWYTKAAGQDHIRAQFKLGWMYSHGCDGVDRDYKKAVVWYTEAAEQGLAGAQSCLGWLYDNGHGVIRNSRKAVEWFAKAAEQGLGSAQYNLGVMYANGRGVDQDEQKAVEWYVKAAEQGHVQAQFALGERYANGRGIDQDEQKAVEWYVKAAEQGHVQAQFALGERYANGCGVSQDEQKAVEWYTKAAEQGHVQAQFNLGVSYDNGCGVLHDAQKAVEWYTKAAEQGNANAQFILGMSYRYGCGVSQDNQKAVEWYTKAANNGHFEAKRALISWK